MDSLPNQLIVIPLTNEVLLPSTVIKLSIQGSFTSSLIEKYQAADEQNYPLYVACIPLIPSDSHPSSKGFFEYGCVAQVLDIEESIEGLHTLSIEGISRFKAIRVKKRDSWVAHVEYIESQRLHYQDESISRFRRIAHAFLETVKELEIPDDLIDQLSNRLHSCSHSGMVDLMVTVIEASFSEKLLMLSTTSLKKRIEIASEWVYRQNETIKLLEQLETELQHGELWSEKQLKPTVKGLKELKAHDRNISDKIISNERLSDAKLPHRIESIIQNERQRLKKTDVKSNEYQALESYIKTVVDLPWDLKTERVIDTQTIKKKLDESHYGLSHAKKRILDYLSELKVKRDIKAPILCFLGPPGVGKTSLGKSIADSLGREFYQIPLGDVQDEKDIRVHKRTYTGSIPGAIIQGLRKCKSNDPLFLLDGVDKTGYSKNCDSLADTLLEILDPEQNTNFLDHYLNIPFDLSNVLFITTANSIDNIPGALLDRMEIIPISGYTFDEKLSIAKSCILPTQLKAHGLAEKNLKISDETILKIAENYTKESGVRSFERKIASIVRAKSAEWANADKAPYTPYVTIADLHRLLGLPLYKKEMMEQGSTPGTTVGLTHLTKGQSGILFVSSTKSPGNGQLVLTGFPSDYEVEETGKLALAWVKSHAYKLKLSENTENNILDKHDVHIHVPEGTISKDGPSLGLTLVASLVSLFSGHHIPTTTAIAGGISSRGLALPVGGIKEKVISAHQSGILKIILPLKNRKSVEQNIPEKLKNGMEFVFVKTVWEALEASLVDDQSQAWRARFSESRL